jgi:hypothetical protein
MPKEYGITDFILDLEITARLAMRMSLCLNARLNHNAVYR